uniref:protein-tyrosine-phosphatase n=2 Tax=Ciona intestinalis TaxID=7719 RepID=F7AQ24_CIOIN
MRIVYTFHSQQRSLQCPIIIHCENGVGHTGTFCSAYSSIQDMDAGLGIPDVLNIVHMMRKKRKFMVQEKAQLKFVHDLVYLHAADLLLQRGVQVDTKHAIPQSPVLTHQPTHQTSTSNAFDVFGSSALSSIKASVEKMTVKPEKVVPTNTADTMQNNNEIENNFTPTNDSTAVMSQTHMTSHLDALMGSNMSDLVQGTITPCDVTNTKKLPQTRSPDIVVPDVVQNCSKPVLATNNTPSAPKPDTSEVKAPVPTNNSEPALNPPKETNISILDQLTPESFTLGAPESKDKKKITKADFYKPRDGIGPKSDASDPFGDLDPLWS